MRWTEPDNSKLLLESSGQNLLWLLVRAISSKTDQEVPSWAGFISALGKMPDCLTTIDLINHPITEYKTVQEVLKYSENATHEVLQEYAITTFDLGVCNEAAYPIIWNKPLKILQTYRTNRHISFSSCLSEDGWNRFRQCFDRSWSCYLWIIKGSNVWQKLRKIYTLS